MRAQHLCHFLVFIVSLCHTGGISAQREGQDFSVIINAGVNVTESLKYDEVYSPFPDSDVITLYKAYPIQQANYNLTVVAPLNERLHFKGSIGVMSYGFQYQGRVMPSPFSFGSTVPFDIVEYYDVRFMEVAGMLEYRVQANHDMQWYLSTGLGWLTNPKGEFDNVLIIFMKSNNFSVIAEGGIEVPVVSNNLRARLGVQGRLPLGTFVDSFDNQSFNPYAFGILTGLKWVF